MRSRRLVCGLVVLGAAAVGCSQGTPELACAAPELAFTDGEDEGDARVNLVDGSEIGVLANDWIAGQPAFSPDDHELAVVRAQGDYESAGPEATELWVVSLDDGDERQLTSRGFAREPDWSTLSDRIVYVERTSSGGELRTIASDGSRQQTVLARDASLGSPQWSPDGRTIAFIESRLAADLQSYTSSVVLVAADDGTVGMSVEVPNAFTLSWSPDGESLLVSTLFGEDGGTVELEAASGEQRGVGEGTTMATYASDGDTVFFLTKEEAASTALWRVARGQLTDGQLIRDSFIGDGSLYGYGHYGMATPHCA